MEADIGLIGLAVMGQNLVLNMNDHGYKVVVFNRTVSKVDDFHCAAGNGNSALTAAAGGETAVIASELNAVMVLEWISNVFYANKLKLMYMWPKIHGK